MPAIASSAPFAQSAHALPACASLTVEANFASATLSVFTGPKDLADSNIFALASSHTAPATAISRPWATTTDPWPRMSAAGAEPRTRASAAPCSRVRTGCNAEGYHAVRMAMDDRLDIRPRPIDFTMDVALEVKWPRVRSTVFPVQVEGEDIGFAHQLWGETARHQEQARVFTRAGADVAKSIDNAIESENLIGQHQCAGLELFRHVELQIGRVAAVNSPFCGEF
jgi:hypothetical protein